MRSVFGSRSSDQLRAEASPSPEAQRLLDEAAKDYAKHNSAETQAAYREQLGQVITNGNAQAGSAQR
ncbi:hypothetical protein GCM10010406_11100 [Streptomyces thermolineatus]|uniref:Antitoxin n=1 Tax=Streptomyces thermolineatus TaxID=44033 RepID=A0ABN3L5E9_9ACTN